jgi:hypothetical protein
MCARLNCAGIGPLGSIAGGNFFYQLDIIMYLVSSAKWCILSLLQLFVALLIHWLYLSVFCFFLTQIAEGKIQERLKMQHI